MIEVSIPYSLPGLGDLLHVVALAGRGVAVEMVTPTLVAATIELAKA